MPRTKLRTDVLRERILQVSLGLLAEEGVAGVTARNVARAAETSPPAVYELFGDKAGLVRELFFDGFRRLRARFEELDTTNDPRADLISATTAFRRFVQENPTLAEVMFSRPFADFEPTASDQRAGAWVRRFVVGRIRRCIAAGVMEGDEVDIAHALVALTQGLTAAETARLLGSTRASTDRRWRVAVNGLIDGFAPKAGRRP